MNTCTEADYLNVGLANSVAFQAPTTTPGTEFVGKALGIGVTPSGAGIACSGKVAVVVPTMNVGKIVGPQQLPAATLTGTPGNLDVGDHRYVLQWLCQDGSVTELSGLSNTITVTNNAVSGQVSLDPTESNYPLSLDIREEGYINIGRDFNATGIFLLVEQVPFSTMFTYDASTQTVTPIPYIDNIPNASLGSALSIQNTTGKLAVEGGLGINGVTPVGIQPGGALTAGNSYTANEKDMIQKMYDALQAVGIVSLV